MPNERPDQLSIDDSGPRVRLAVPAMTRVLALLVALIPTVMITLAEDESRQNLSIDRSVLDASEAIRLRAWKNSRKQKEMPKAWNASAKMVLSQVEMEQRLLKLMECEAELASARLAEAKGKVAKLESGAASGESAKDQLASAKAALKQLSEATEAQKQNVSAPNWKSPKQTYTVSNNC